MLKNTIDETKMKMAINILKENFGVKSGERFYLTSNSKSPEDLSLFKLQVINRPIPELGSLITVYLAKYFFHNNTLIQEHEQFLSENEAKVFTLELITTIDEITSGKLIPVKNLDGIDKDKIFTFLDKQRLELTHKLCPDIINDNSM